MGLYMGMHWVAYDVEMKTMDGFVWVGGMRQVILHKSHLGETVRRGDKIVAL